MSEEDLTLKNQQELHHKTVETGTLEDTKEATIDNNNKNKKNKKSLQITTIDGYNRNSKNDRPKKMRLSKTNGNM